ncbi:MAG: GDP-mannose 4,6-dehydratase [Verrucomicrobiae bacterium]|nr:GDP-mannose 4,6-dehydratase [Verrucomicrobiae bacterium]
MHMSKKALITGITGQDGSYLTELLLGKGYEVHGLVRRTSTVHRERLDALFLDPETRPKQLVLHYGDLADPTGLVRLFHKVDPDEIYHLGGQSHIGISFESPEYSFDINASGTLHLLECLRDSNHHAKFYHASSSEIFGRPETSPQNEKTSFRPVSPYACAKAAAHFMTTCYRESYGLFACNGILYNHESPRRGENFVTRKIARGVAAIAKGRQKIIKLGNLDVKKDWGYAPEYVEAMWRMLQGGKPDDYVIATGEAHSVRDFVAAAFAHVGLDWQKHIETDSHQFRPNEVGLMIGDASKARKELDWQPRTRFEALVKLMVDAELKALE